MTFSINHGYVETISSENAMVKSSTNEQWDAQFLQINNVLNPSKSNDVATKSYHDINSINILQNKGDLIVFNGNENKAAIFPAGANNSVIQYDNTVDSGMKAVIDLTIRNITQTGILTTETIQKPANKDALILENVMSINDAGNTLIVKMGDVAMNTNNVELILESKQDICLYIKADSNGTGNMDDGQIVITGNGNKVFTGIALNKPNNQIRYMSASDGSIVPPDIVFQINGSYDPIGIKPEPNDFTDALTISGTVGDVSIPTKLTTGNFVCNQISTAVTIQGLFSQPAESTTTLTGGQVLLGLIIGSPSFDSVYTMPPNMELVGSVVNPIVGQFFKFTIFNDNAAFKIDLKINGQTPMTPLGFGSILKVILPQRTANFICIFDDVDPSSEQISIIAVDF